MSLFKDLIPNPRVSPAEWPWDKTSVEQRSPWRSLAIKERRKTDIAHLCYTSTFHYILGGIFFHWDKHQPRTLESLNYCLGFSWFSTESHTSQESLRDRQICTVNWLPWVQTGSLAPNEWNYIEHRFPCDVRRLLPSSNLGLRAYMLLFEVCLIYLNWRYFCVEYNGWTKCLS